MGIAKSGLKLVEVITTGSNPAIRLSSKTEKQISNILLDFKKYGLTQGERKLFGKEKADFLDKKLSELSPEKIKSEISEYIKKVNEKAPNFRKIHSASTEPYTEYTLGEDCLRYDIDDPDIAEVIRNEFKKHNIDLRELNHIDIPYYEDYDLTLNTVRAKIKAKPETGKILSIEKDGLQYNIEAKSVSLVEFFSKPCKVITFSSEAMQQPYYMETSLKKGLKTVERQIYTESAIPGQYEIFDVLPSGKRYKAGLAEIGKNGEKHIERHLVSIDGKTTDLVYRDDNKGNTFLYSVIKDKDGEVMSETRRKFKKFSDNHFMSSYNGQSYDIKWGDEKVVITKLDQAGKKTEKIVEYAIKEMDSNELEKEFTVLRRTPSPFMSSAMGDILEKLGFARHSIDKKLVSMMKAIPGDEWFAMSKCNSYVIVGGKQNNAECFGETLITMSEELKDNYSIFMHELGHAKYYHLGLSSDEQLLEIYTKERQNFQHTFPEEMYEKCYYYIQKPTRGRSEIAAETNLINNTVGSWDKVKCRIIFLEKYFPETIAYIKNKFAAM